ncbi:MAG: deoxyribodipyrimidine photo-lyase [Bacteroidetes bacterium]|nr:deoxyribodipyrimidine photo-lyase [Bacteroidota bacterium]
MNFVQPFLTLPAHQKCNIFWFRRDLRLEDNHGLWECLRAGLPVLPLFIFDTEILGKLENPKDRRVQFIHQEILRLKTELRAAGSDLLVLHGNPHEIWPTLLASCQANAIYTNRDYEPAAIQRDDTTAKTAAGLGVAFHSFKDQVIFETHEVVKDDGTPYTVYTPYSKKWKSVLQESQLEPYNSAGLKAEFITGVQFPVPTLEEMGFQATAFVYPQARLDKNTLAHYASDRDYPWKPGTTRVSLALRFGTLSVRELYRIGFQNSEKWVNELIWREFYMQILFHFPYVVGSCFRPEYNRIVWRNNEAEFEAWCNGNTGYPIVDAGMRELKQTGYMHNRVRMITASFLTKHLLIDWRWGEAWFAQHLLDFELSSNNGGWQWAAGCGVDAAPYFRIFNPYLQTLKFDPNLTYIRRWVAEFDSLKYSKPLVDHDFARKRCLQVYQAALQKP